MTEAKKFLLPAAIATMLAIGLCPGAALAVGAAAVGENDAFALRALDRVLEKWSAPDGARNASVRIRLSLDRDGQLLACRTVKASASGALDRSACAAAKAAQPFGPPPYGLPVELYMAFWTGKGTAAPGSRRAAAEQAGGEKPAPAPDAAQQKYLNAITRSLRNSIYIPVQTAPGTYTVRARIEVAADGRIKNSEISGSSGDALLDKYVLQGIRRAGKVSPPPRGLGPEIGLTFRLTRS